ncbi:MAG: hypothetical protein NTW28_26370 [Candidatus Solibacter sp.]|nr:hypothetical protein [Candidatus Solibacter sp.]
MRAGLEFHRRLNGYRFPYTGAVVLRGIPTCQQVKFQFSTTEIGDDTRLQEVESLRSVPNPNFNPTDFRSDGDGTVPAFSQSDIPTFSLLAGGLATDMVPSVIGIKHADALAGKVDGRPDRRVFRQVYGLLNRLHENARQRKLGGFR